MLNFAYKDKDLWVEDSPRWNAVIDTIKSSRIARSMNAVLANSMASEKFVTTDSAPAPAGAPARRRLTNV